MSRVRGASVVAALAALSLGLIGRPTPNASAQSPIPALEARWTRVTPLGANVTHLAVTSDGNVWARVGVGDRPSGRDRVVRWQGSPPIVSFIGTIKTGAERAAGPQAGAKYWPPSLAGFWSTDATGRTWTGAKHFFRGKWTDLTTRLAADLGVIAWSDEAVLDAAGRAWVPYTIIRACPQPPDCSDTGLRAFGATGILTAGLTLEAVPEADAMSLPPLWLLAGEQNAKGEWLGPFAAGSRDLYTLPSTAGSRYPPFETIPGSAASSGYATAASRTTTNHPGVLTWSEERVRDVGIFDHHQLYTWLGGKWSEPDVLDDSPLVTGTRTAAGTRLMAFVRSMDGEVLWVAGSGSGGAAGGVARRTGRAWDLAFSWDKVGLRAKSSDPTPVAHAMVLDDAGRLWLATSAGLAVYATDSPEVVDLDAGALYFPLARRR